MRWSWVWQLATWRNSERDGDASGDELLEQKANDEENYGGVDAGPQIGRLRQGQFRRRLQVVPSLVARKPEGRRPKPRGNRPKQKRHRERHFRLQKRARPLYIQSTQSIQLLPFITPFDPLPRKEAESPFSSKSFNNFFFNKQTPRLKKFR